jgi:hypothetical protein
LAPSSTCRKHIGALGAEVEQETALRIATGAVTLKNSQRVKDAGAVLLDKLSNFRAVGLANDRELLVADLDTRLGMALRMEMQRRQMDHSVLVESSGRWLPVNHFQQRFWNNAISHTWCQRLPQQHPGRRSWFSNG